MEGYEICKQCEKFCFIYRAEVLRKLPKDYHGENCDDCGLRVVAIEKVEEGAKKE